MGIIIRKSGLFTTIQDYGRVGYQEFGFSVCGVMDKRSARIANMLVDNSRYEAVLEITINGPIIEFTESNIIAITGGDFKAKINDKKVNRNEAILVKEGDVLSFEYARTGSRGYIAFAGGLAVEKAIGSKSTDTRCKIGGFKGRALKAGDYIKFEKPKDYLPNFLSRKVKVIDKVSNHANLRVVLGPQDNYFTEKGIKTFFTETYTVTNEFDRMGCRLDGAVIEHKSEADIISDGIAFGAVQVPSHGRPIIMLADRQTTGGYSKIGNIISVDIPKLVQRKPGDTISFKYVSLKEAQKLCRDEKMFFRKLRDDIHKPCIEILEPRNTSKKIEETLLKGSCPF